jgi:hypothetical protein
MMEMMALGHHLGLGLALMKDQIKTASSMVTIGASYYEVVPMVW